ncbi:GntR family transcriptional regulator [Gemmata sp. JC673]|uniref:GntR family transcriptional regulator n=1 Tax=Gemmata algarum TaxID=2975278 RepID=A0ABU5ESX9_9BACT|nr:GntR family transcriptional regulator [Gemmata algarum]MDY3558196.1 GntR family transcriptional regulator [Gemmata algarum]
MPELTTTSEPAFDHGLRRQALVRAILTDIFHGKYRAGQRLVTEALAQRFGVSHTPIREALIELGTSGIVNLLPNRGAVVRQVTARDVREVLQVRKVLECEAVRGAARRADPVRVAAIADDIRALAARPPGPEAVAVARDLDNTLHDYICAACGNSFLQSELARLRTLYQAFRDVTWDLEEARSDFHRLGVEAGEHLAITDALRARDPRAAVRAMTAHIRSGVKYWLQVSTNLDPS